MQDQLLDVFRSEVSERLDSIVGLLVGVEDGSGPADAVDALFRDAHSIKGSAGMVGFEATHALAHALEEQLSGARAQGGLTPAAVPSLLALADALRDSVGAAPAPPAEQPPMGVATTVAPPAATPASIRMPADKVDRLLDAVGESVLQMRRLEQSLDLSERDDGAEWELSRGKAMLGELQRAAIDMRTLPLGSIAGRYPRAVRDLAVEAGKEVELVTAGMDTQLDRVILEGISETIVHLLRNAVAHGIEPPDERLRAGKPRAGRIVLRAEPRGGLVAVEVGDDGRGVSAEVQARAQREGSLVSVLCAPGFSTAGEVSDVAGRGVGLDAVKAHVEALGGGLEIESEPGAGTLVRLLLPYSVALTAVLLIERDGQAFGVPLANVEEVTVVDETLSLGGRRSLELRGRSVPLVDLATVLGGRSRTLGERPRALIVRASGRRQAVACDRILGEQDVVVKSLGALLAGVRGYLGAAIVDGGAIAPILDPRALTTPRDGDPSPVQPEGEPPRVPKVLVVDDQFTVRELQRSILEAAGYRVATARNGREACGEIAAQPDIDLVVTDMQMPEMDGLELLQTIRRDPRRASLPVVVLTSLGSEDDKRRGAEAGADAYIVKDEFDQRALLDTVERLVDR